MAFGRYYEEFEVGAIYKHWPGRTVSEQDNVWFALLSMNQHPLFIDAHFAATAAGSATPPPAAVPSPPEAAARRPIVDTLIFSLAVGMSVADTSGKTLANLGYERVLFEAPLYAGDSLYAESEVLSRRLSASQPDHGIVEIETRAFNQRGVRVLVLRRAFLAPRAPAAS